MRIAYGVHGYGRGHAMRALAVLPELTRRHEVLVLAGGDAYDALATDYPVRPIPTLCFEYTSRGDFSTWLSFKRNVPKALDLRFGGPSLRAIERQIVEFAPDVIITDSEGFTHRAAKRLGIPRISFDHFGILVYCRPALAPRDRLRRFGSALTYRGLFGDPDRAIVSSFFSAPAARTGVCVIGPVIRKEVEQTESTDGEHLLVYLSKGSERLMQRLEPALAALKLPARVYGAAQTGRLGLIEFKPIANLPFIRDLASCRAVIGTTGNQLLGEVVYYRKPILGIPVECLEQRLNAIQIEAMGIGRQAKCRDITANSVAGFLHEEHRFRAAFPSRTRSAVEESVETIERFAAELIGDGATRHGRAGAKDAAIEQEERPKCGLVS